MKPFTLTTVSSAEAALAAAALGGRYVAGGTTLVDLMREEVEQPDHLIDINRLPLRHVAREPEGLVIGALARMSEVAAHPFTREDQPLIAEALLEGASPQLRNMASIGGNLLQRVRCPYFRTLDAACNKRTPGTGCAALEGINRGHALFGTSQACVATHASDLAVALTALDAVVRTHGPAGGRSFPVEALYRLPGDSPHLEHTLEAGELIIEVVVPPNPFAGRTRYLKVRDRASYEFAVVSVAAALEVRDGLIFDVRLAAGGVATMPWRLRAVEAALRGRPAQAETFAAAAQRATAGARPLAHNGFKLVLLPRTIVRALEMTGAAA